MVKGLRLFCCAVVFGELRDVVDVWSLCGVLLLGGVVVVSCSGELLLGAPELGGGSVL